MQFSSAHDGIVQVRYRFQTTGRGSRLITPWFRYAGVVTATVSDFSSPARAATTNAPAATYNHGGAPTGIQHADGSMVTAWTGFDGRLNVWKNTGSADEPIQGPQLDVRDPINTGGANQIGADTPTFARMGSTLALFHTYPSGHIVTCG